MNADMNKLTEINQIVWCHSNYLRTQNPLCLPRNKFWRGEKDTTIF